MSMARQTNTFGFQSLVWVSEWLNAKVREGEREKERERGGMNTLRQTRGHTHTGAGFSNHGFHASHHEKGMHRRDCVLCRSHVPLGNHRRNRDLSVHHDL